MAMEKPQIPEDVQRFIMLSVPSVPYLEAMLLIRNEPAESWDKARVSRRLYMAEKPAGELLQQLHEAGILSRDNAAPDRYRYAPSTSDLADMIERLAQTYAGNLIGVTNLIHVKTVRKAVRFADAFKWKKES
jgi:hypothetical protein